MDVRNADAGQSAHMAAVASSYRELKVYRSAFHLQQKLFFLSRDWPREEAYALTARLLRSARSVGADLAQACTRQPEPEEYRLRLRIAGAEIAETMHWLETAYDCGYLADAKYAELRDQCEALRNMLTQACKQFPLEM